MSENEKKGFQAIKNAVVKSASSIDMDTMKEKALKAGEVIGEKAQEIKSSTIALKEDITDKLMERVKQTIDVEQKLLAAGKDALDIGKKVSRMPGLA